MTITVDPLTLAVALGLLAPHVLESERREAPSNRPTPLGGVDARNDDMPVYLSIPEINAPRTFE